MTTNCSYTQTHTHPNTSPVLSSLQRANFSLFRCHFVSFSRSKMSAVVVMMLRIGQLTYSVSHVEHITKLEMLIFCSCQCGGNGIVVKPRLRYFKLFWICSTGCILTNP